MYQNPDSNAYTDTKRRFRYHNHQEIVIALLIAFLFLNLPIEMASARDMHLTWIPSIHLNLKPMILATLWCKGVQSQDLTCLEE
jgi:hypothetical protein